MCVYTYANAKHINIFPILKDLSSLYICIKMILIFVFTQKRINSVIKWCPDGINGAYTSVAI